MIPISSTRVEAAFTSQVFEKYFCIAAPPASRTWRWLRK
jgi:hypothetical protein